MFTNSNKKQTFDSNKEDNSVYKAASSSFLGFSWAFIVSKNFLKMLKMCPNFNELFKFKKSSYK